MNRFYGILMTLIFDLYILLLLALKKISFLPDFFLFSIKFIAIFMIASENFS